jgi:predicted dehydrogenase
LSKKKLVFEVSVEGLLMRSPDFDLTPSQGAHCETSEKKSGTGDSAQPKDAPKKLRVGVVGCGYWGANYIRILSSLNMSGLVAVEINREILDATVAAYPLVRPCTDLKAALPHVDALIIASPPLSHSDLAVLGLRHHKHILLEKPMALSVAQALSLIEVAESSKSVLMVGHTFEFNAAVQELKRRLVGGELGRITRINSARLKGPYRSDVNVVWDMVPHDISIMNYLLDSTPSTVTAWASNGSPAGIADVVYIKVEYLELGITGYIHASWLGFKKVREITVVGTRKVAVHDDTMKQRLHLFDRVDAREDFAGQLLAYGSGVVNSPNIEFEEPLVVQVKHFLHSINESTPPQTDGANGLAVVAALEAIDESIVKGRTVKVYYPSRVMPSNAPKILPYCRLSADQ